MEKRKKQGKTFTVLGAGCDLQLVKEGLCER